MNVFMKRMLGDAFIVTSWALYVCAFAALWAPLLPLWANLFILVAAIAVGHGIGSAWSRRVRYGPPRPTATWS